MQHRKLGEILVEEAIVSAETVERALANQSGSPRRRLGQLLIEEGVLDAGWLTAALAQQAGVETVDPLALAVDPARLWMVPPDVAERLGAFVACDEAGPIAVLADPTAPGTGRALESLLGVPSLRIAAGLPDRVAAAIALHYDLTASRRRRLRGVVGEQRPALVCPSSSEMDVRRVLGRLTRPSARAHTDFAMALVVYAVESGAERLRIESGVVRATWDGLEHIVMELPGAQAVLVTARLRALAKLDAASTAVDESEMTLGDHVVPVRARWATGPVGGTVDLRFHLGAAPEDVRMAPKVESTWRGLLSQPGLILLVGPEGAGFGTTVSAGPSTARVRLRRAEDVERAVRAAEGGQTVLARIVAPGLA